MKSALGRTLGFKPLDATSLGFGSLVFSTFVLGMLLFVMGASAKAEPSVQSGILSHETVVTERYPQRVDPTRLVPYSSTRVEQAQKADMGGSADVAAVTDSITADTVATVATVATVDTVDTVATGRGHVSVSSDSLPLTVPSRVVQPRISSDVPQPVFPGSPSPSDVATIDVYSLSPSAHLLALPKNGAAQGKAGKSRHASSGSPSGVYPSDSASSVYSESGARVTVRKSRPLPPEWRGLIREASQIFGLEEKLLEAVIRVESGFDAWAESPAGAQGAMQIMPRTQIELGLIDPFDPRANIYAGAEYLLRQMQRFGDMRLALAAYNAGPANVEKYGGIPPFAETQSYVKQVMGLWQASN